MRAFFDSPWTIAGAALLSGVILWYAPDGITERIHAAATDALRPGWQSLHIAQQSIQNWRTTHTNELVHRLQAELAQANAALQEETERVQRLSAQLASANSASADERPHSSVASEERLFVPALVEAAVLGDSLSQAWREGRVLDRGWKHGVRETALVLQGRGPLIDLGAAAQIVPEDPLLVGRTIVGKVTVVGRWTSIVLPVTDTAYRGRAQLVRDSERGPIWGAEGLLVGNGAGRCRLEGIPVEEAVRVGDLVYSAERDGALSAPLAYGRVCEARASPDDREWTLIVEPAVRPKPTTRVHVLRAALNPARLWAN